MRTTLDLPKDVLRRAKIAAKQRDTTLRELVIDALRRELERPSPRSRQRMNEAPIQLAADSPLRSLGLDDVKQLDEEAALEAEMRAAGVHPKL
jgi:hypothetical protein